MNKFFLLSLIFLFIISCSGVKHLDVSKPLTPDMVINHINARNSRISSFFAEGKISLDIPESPGPGMITVKILKPDSIMLEVSGMFGVSGVKALMTNSKFIFFNVYENTFAEGETNAENLQRVLRFRIEFRDIIEILSGTMTIRSDSNDPPPVGVLSDNAYLLKFKHENASDEYIVDLGYDAVRRFVRRDEFENVVEDITFKDFRKRGGYYFPHIISISRPKADENVVLIYDNIRINDANLDFNLKIPASTKRIHF